MNPLRVTASNYRTFPDLDLELPTGCVVIGGRNGAGKSSILNAIDVALFCGRGELPGLLSLGQEELTLELEFEHAGELYRVRRMYSAKGRGKTTLDLEATDGPLGEWRPQTRETAEETQRHLEQLLGLSRTTFRASSFLAQGDGAAFTDAQPRDRKAILAEILGLDLWDRLLDKARTELRVAEHEIAGTAATVARLEDTVAQRAACTAARDSSRRLRDEASEVVADAEEQLEQAQQQLAVAAAAEERVLARKAEVEAARAAHASADEKLREAITAAGLVEGIRVELGEIEADAARIPTLEQQLETVQEAARVAAEGRRRRDDLAAQVEQREQARQRLIEQTLALRAAAEDLLAKAAHLTAHIGESASCDRCGQTLGAEAAARAAGSFSTEAADLDRRAAELDAGNDAELAAISGLREQLAAIETPVSVEDPQPVERALAAARQSAEKRGQLKERLARLLEIVSRRADLELDVASALLEFERRQGALNQELTQLGDLPGAEQSVQAAKTAVRDARTTLELRAGELARAEQRLEQLIAAQAELDQLRAATADLHARVDLLKLAERAYGRDGIPALIVENAAIPQIELEANRILGELGGATVGCRIELRTQRALKGSEQLRETLDIVIRTAAGDRPYESFSGGERTRLNLALRIALARLLAHRRGAQSRLLAIDEPDGLDAQGVDALASVLAGLSGDFDRILVVSHQPQLATSFDQAIVVVKDGDRSRIDVGAPERVTA